MKCFSSQGLWYETGKFLKNMCGKFGIDLAISVCVHLDFCFHACLCAVKENEKRNSDV
jgi:hypothetical protein